MSTKETGGLNPNHHPAYQNDAVAPQPKPTLELSGYIDERYFQSQDSDYARGMYAPPDQAEQRRGEGEWDRGSTSGTDDEDDEEEEDSDDDVVVVEGANGKNNSSSDKMMIGSGMEIILKEGNAIPSGSNINDLRASSSENHHQGGAHHYQSAITLAVAESDLYSSRYLQGPEGSAADPKDTVAENGCGYNGRKYRSYSGESRESLRAILSDPLTGALMDDAMILSCGHSFGSGGMEHVTRMKTCYTCSQPVSAVAPNLSLRSAVQAFRREEELQMHRASKRRRERFDQDKTYVDSNPVDHSRGRGVQFPFVVTDRVIIKGNKRTPERFVGREAVVTTQCLNGWYVVKTLDNAESVKLQYRSLAKVPDNPTSKASSSKTTPNWL